MKTYYGALTRNHHRFFIIRNYKLRAAPPSRFSTMTSAPACKKNKIISETVYGGDEISVDQFLENVVTLSKSVGKPETVLR